MIDMDKILRSGGMQLEKVLSRNEDHAVLKVRRADTECFVLRVYRREIPVYRQLERAPQEGFPKVYHTYEEDGLFLVEEEYVEGISLETRLKTIGCCSEVRAMKLIRPVCQALDRLHSMGYIHRDVKPAHIILSESGRVVLVDLDGSMNIQSEKKQDTQLMGTVSYAAPEQFGLNRSDQRADVYAVGILMNVLLTGEHPTVKRYQEGHLGDVIQKCIRMNREERYQSVRELAAELELKKPSAKRKPAAAIIAALLVVLIAAGAFLLGQSDEPYDPQNIDAALAAQPFTVDGVAYLPLFRGTERDPVYTNYRRGSQHAQLFTEDDVLIDGTWTVSTDEEVGWIVGWAEEYQAWRVCSEGCNMESRGYLYAKKDEQNYAIPVVVVGEPMSAYSEVPKKSDVSAGYIQPQIYPEIYHQNEIVKLSYRREEPLLLYLVAMEGFPTLEPSCEDAHITIEPFEGAVKWDMPVFTMTYSNPEGGDAVITVDHNFGDLIFVLEEEE